MLRIMIAGLVLGSLLSGCNSNSDQSLRPSGQNATAVTGTPLVTSNSTHVVTPTLTVEVNETSTADHAVPTLRILSPKDGQTITLPAEIHYQITGFAGEDTPSVHIHAFVGDPSRSYQIEIPIENLSGIAILPDEKAAFLPGRRDLTFQLAYPDHTLVPNPEARVTIYNLTIEGRR